MFKNIFFFKGALIGAGASVIGIGTDLAGSIRVPSLYNGIFGHKPTAGKFNFFFKHMIPVSIAHIILFP